MKLLMMYCLRVSCIGLVFLSYALEAVKVKSSGRIVTLIPHTSYLGKECERLAQQKIAKRYPKKKFKLLKNITYRSHSITGELDIVVINKKTSKVIYIGEVKCWKNLFRASKAADRQLNRFKRVVKQSLTKPRRFFLKERASSTRLNISQFYGHIVYQKICQKSAYAQQFGFVPLSLSRKEILQS